MYTNQQIAVQQPPAEIRLIKRVICGNITTSIYNNGIVEIENFTCVPPKKIEPEEKERERLFKEALEEVNFAFKKRGAKRGVVRWK